MTNVTVVFVFLTYLQVVPLPRLLPVSLWAEVLWRRPVVELDLAGGIIYHIWPGDASRSLMEELERIAGNKEVWKNPLCLLHLESLGQVTNWYVSINCLKIFGHCVIYELHSLNFQWPAPHPSDSDETEAIFDWLLQFSIQHCRLAFIMTEQSWAGGG